MRGFIVRVAQIAVTLTVGFAILASLAVWRVAQGPVSLNFLTPALERTFAFKETPFAVQVDDTALVWGGWQRVADLRARNLRVFGPDGKLVALLPEVSIGLSFRGLLRGDLAISRFDVLGLQASIERFEDGRFGFEMPVDAAGSKSAESSMDGLAGDILRPIRERTGPFRYLQRIAVLSARLRYNDRKNGNVWSLPRANVVAKFHHGVIDTDLALTLDMDGKRTQLFGTILHDLRSGRNGGRLEFRDLEPGLIARAVPDLRRLEAVQATVSGAAHFDLARDWTPLSLNLKLASRIGNATVAMRYPPTGGVTNVVVELANLRLAAMAPVAPELALLGGIDVPVSGKVVGSILSREQIRIASVDLTIGRGQIELTDLLPKALPVKRARLKADMADDLSTMAVHEFELDLGGPAISASGTVQRTGTAYRMQADARATGVPMADLADYWPVGAAEDTRDWILANIVEGTMSDATAKLVMSGPVDDIAAAQLESVKGTLQYQGLSVDYWSNMPKFTDVGGTATFDQTRFNLAVTNGRMRDLAVDQGVINISGLDQQDQKITIDLGLRGSAQTLAHVLDREPLRYISKIGLSPDDISGEAIVRSNIRFPLLSSLSVDQVRVSALGTLRNLGVASAPYNLSVSQGDLTLQVTNTDLSARGIVHLSSLPVTVDWKENFVATAAPRRRLVLSGRVPDLGRLGFGLPETDFVRGPADANLVLTAMPGGNSELLVGAELLDATVSLSDLGWEKPAGTPGTASVLLTIDKSNITSVEQFSVEAGKTRLLGSARPRVRGDAGWRVEVSKFENAGSDLRGRIDIEPDGALMIDVAGKRFDAAPLLDKAMTDEPAADTKPGRRMKVSGRFGELLWGPERRLRDANILLHHTGQHTQGLVLDGIIGRRGKLSVKYVPGPDGQILRVAADDFGALLDASPSRSKVVGGTILIRGLRSTPDGPLKGEFVTSQFRVSKAVALAKVLQVASLSGIVDALSRKGLGFDAFEGAFVYRDGRITFSKASAHGPSLGITVDGVVDFEKDTAKFGGTLVPAYSLNRVIGKIPVIGSLLTGGEREGVFAATYRITGPLDDPQVSVNPLSALAPGFLRNLFGLGAGRSATAAPAPATKPEQRPAEARE